MATELRKVRNSITRTMIASLAALTVGVAFVGSGGSAFADPSTSHNTYNPLNPFAATNSAEIGSFNANSSAAAESSDTTTPIIPVGQGAPINCHLLTGFSNGVGCQ